jgi:small-conductance mechanosensitive channel
VAAGLAGLIACLWLRQLARVWLHKWSRETGWKGFDILRDTTGFPSIIWAVALAAWLAILVYAIPTDSLYSDWMRYVSKGLWTLFALSLALCLLSMADRLIALWGEHLKAFEHDTRAFWYLVRIVVVVVTALTLLEIWGADLTAILLAMGILTVLAILVMRDIGPDLVAGVQVSSARHFKDGDYIKLKETGEEGYVTGMSWRNTTVKGPGGSMTIIPNRKLAQATVINYGHPVKKAKKPFTFYSRSHIKELTGLKARNLRELADTLRVVPDSVIYYHTHHFLEEHHYLTPQPANDLAMWVDDALGDEVLAEKLAAVDTFQFTSLQALRDRHVSIIEEQLTRGGIPRESAPGDEFHFVKSISVIIKAPYEAGDMREFVEALRKLSPGSLYFHIFESRLRLGRGLNDFSAWLADSLDEHELADRIARLDPYTYTLEGLRAQLIELIEKEMGEATRL